MSKAMGEYVVETMTDLNCHFVGNPDAEDSLTFLRELAWEDGIDACVRHAWVWPLFCQLKMRGFRVSFSYGLEKGAVNFVHGQIARHLLCPSDFKTHFIVGIRADFRPFPYGQFEIVQNRSAAGGHRIFMPHFPQPGLLSRDESRNEVSNVCFAGQENNFVDVTRLVKDLKQIGCRYVFKGQGEWQNMQDVDILLGTRSFSKKTYPSKPPSKLFNAWLAGIPFIGGYDSAFSQVGSPSENYIRVSSYAEQLDAIQRLKNNPVLYRRLVEAGREAVKPYTVDMITQQWLDFLNEKVSPLYRQWENGSVRLKLRSAFFGNCFGCYEKLLRRH